MVFANDAVPAVCEDVTAVNAWEAVSGTFRACDAVMAKLEVPVNWAPSTIDIEPDIEREPVYSWVSSEVSPNLVEPLE